ncbi:hydroxyacid dehydrogenase [bacterium]|nr:hydroxyacid dehydrogenase [bacterium]
MNPRCVAVFDPIDGILRQGLVDLGWDVVDALDQTPQTLSQPERFVGWVLRSRLRLGAADFDYGPGLRFVARLGAGMENIDVNAAAARGIACLRSPEGNRDAVAEHCLMALLMLMNRIRSADARLRAGFWEREPHRGTELRGKTVGILGYGFMGEAFASKLSGMDCRVLACDKYRSGFGASFVEEVGLETLFEQTDVLSLHLPLTDETRQWVDADFLSRFRKPIYLLNTARGPIVNQSDLVAALASGKVLGAGLDVFEEEELGFEGMDLKNPTPALNALMESDKTVLSPHIAGWTVESRTRLSAVLLEKIAGLFRSAGQ